MTIYLLDVNVLIALVDPSHVQHDLAHTWFSKVGHKSFATCPLTENGLIRIVGHPRYPNTPGPPSEVLPSLKAMRALRGHVFWPDRLSVADETLFLASSLSNHARVTDAYLVALARANRGKLATMDRRLATEIVPSGTASIEMLEKG